MYEPRRYIREFQEIHAKIESKDSYFGAKFFEIHAYQESSNIMENVLPKNYGFQSVCQKDTFMFNFILYFEIVLYL